ncbi:MAG: HEAT repeat domain-containing protein [Bacteroidota bacterium]
MKQVEIGLQNKDASIRIAALQALPPLVEKGADMQAMLTPILNALQDSDPFVRRAALQALRTLVEKGADVAGILIRLREVWQKERSYEIRRANSEALETVLNLKGVETISDKKLVEQILSISGNMLSDNQDIFHQKALDNLEKLYTAVAPDIKSGFTFLGRKVLERFSTEALINMYWLRPNNKAIVHFIVPRIYATPLISQGSKEESKWRLVLYPNAGDAIIWEKAQEEVRNFEKLVQDDIEESEVRILSTLNSSTSDYE